MSVFVCVGYHCVFVCREVCMYMIYLWLYECGLIFFFLCVCILCMCTSWSRGHNQRKWARFANLRDRVCETGSKEPGDIELLVPARQAFYPPQLKRLSGLLWPVSGSHREALCSGVSICAHLCFFLREGLFDPWIFHVAVASTKVLW